MLGGIDHASKLVAGAREQGPPSLVVAAGPMLFQSPMLTAQRRAQATDKAETMARGLRHLGLSSWAPGLNDLVLGRAALRRLSQIAGAEPLDALAAYRGDRVRAARLEHVGGALVGVIGLTLPSDCDPPLLDEAERVLEQAAQSIRGADISIALLAMERRDARRLAERNATIDLFVNGAAMSDLQHDDTPPEPEFFEHSVMVTAPNHLRGLVVLDFTLAEGDSEFEEVGGLKVAQERARLERVIAALTHGLERWSLPTSGVSAEDLAKRRLELFRAKEARRLLHQPEHSAGSGYRYQLREVREQVGADPRVTQILSEYYSRINEQNRRSFADRLPAPLGTDDAGYLGAELCRACHAAAGDFWERTEHGSAYATLEAEHKEYNLDCVGCHVSGYEKPGGSTVSHVEKLKNVQCESCHGPGSKHLLNLSDPTLLVAKPPETLCAQECHYPPHVAEDWDPRRVWDKIVGPGHGAPPSDSSSELDD